MNEFFPIETPYSSEEYNILKQVVNMGIDSHLEGFVKSKFMKSPSFNNKYRWEFDYSELPILYRRLQELYEKTGNEDYYNYKTDIQDAAQQEEREINNKEIQEEDFFEQRDAQVVQAPINEAPWQNALERFVSFIGGNSHVEEAWSDSLANEKGMNLKPGNFIDENQESGKFENIIFLQGENADEALSILEQKGPESALNYLVQFHNSGEHKTSPDLLHAESDQAYEKNGYIMSWNIHMHYIGLQYDTNFDSIEISEDAIAFRKIAGQRSKNSPLGRHAPHSQNSKNNE